VASGTEAARRGAEGRRAGRWNLGGAASIALIWAVGISGFLLIYWGSKLTFFLDDWEFLIYRRGFSTATILGPHNENIVVGPILVYKLLLAVFGMSSALPFRIVSVGAFLVSAVLLFVYLRRRIGQLAALAGTLVVLFLGSAWEDLFWPFQIGYFGSMVGGLGALVAFDRDDRRGEMIASVGLTVAVLFSSLGLPFLVCFAVLILAREDRWRRLWVLVVPALVYAVWYIGWGHTAENAISAGNIATSPIFLINGFAGSLASLFGLATGTTENVTGGLEWGRPILVVLIGLGIVRAYFVGRLSVQFWAILALGLSFWLLAGINAEAGRTATASRYQYIGVIFILLIAAELLRGTKLDPRLARWTTVLVGVATLVSVVSNVDFLNQAYKNGYHRTSMLEKASLGALEIARGHVEPNFLLSEELTGTGYVSIEAGPYFSARDEFGSPAYTPAEIEAAPEYDRYSVDKVIFNAEQGTMTAVPASSLPRRTPQSAAGEGVFEVPADGCVRTASDGGSSPELALPPGGAYIKAEGEPISNVMVRRFADKFAIQFQEGVAAGEVVELAIPADHSSVPWKVKLVTPGPATVCGLGDSSGGAG
jgi:hypothetical protein